MVQSPENRGKTLGVVVWRCFCLLIKNHLIHRAFQCKWKMLMVLFVMHLCVCAEDRPSALGSVLLRWWRAESGGHWAGQPRRQEGPSEMHTTGQPVPFLSGQYIKKMLRPIWPSSWNDGFVQWDHCWYFIHLLLIMDENSLWMESGSPCYTVH